MNCIHRQKIENKVYFDYGSVWLNTECRTGGAGPRQRRVFLTSRMKRDRNSRLCEGVPPPTVSAPHSAFCLPQLSSLSLPVFIAHVFLSVSFLLPFLSLSQLPIHLSFSLNVITVSLSLSLPVFTAHLFLPVSSLPPSISLSQPQTVSSCLKSIIVFHSLNFTSQVPYFNCIHFASCIISTFFTLSWLHIFLTLSQLYVSIYFICTSVPPCPNSIHLSPLSPPRICFSVPTAVHSYSELRVWQKTILT